MAPAKALSCRYERDKEGGIICTSTDCASHGLHEENKAWAKALLRNARERRNTWVRRMRSRFARCFVRKDTRTRS
jgi:hypothetical protein